MARGKNRYGPGFLVTAAFIGPGTVTSATLAGARFGFDLIWVLVLATMAAIILQEMAGRFTLSTRVDIASALVTYPVSPVVRRSFAVLAFVAIVVGCAAYEAGNVVGGSLGGEILTSVHHRIWIVILSAAALGLLLKNDYRLIERLLVGLVVIMGVSFVIVAVTAAPSLLKILGGLRPRIPSGSLVLVLALLGTTVVPYNLFLHSAGVLKKWRNDRELRFMRRDLFLSIGLGGIVTASIVITAAVTYFAGDTPVSGPSDLALQLKPLFGRWAGLFFGFGFFSAGLTSAITAPYAASLTAGGLFRWPEKDNRRRLTAAVVLLSGMLVGLTGVNPLQLIILAQVTNAVLLPVVSLFLLFLLNRAETGTLRNSLPQNLLFLLVFLVILLINIKQLL